MGDGKVKSEGSKVRKTPARASAVHPVPEDKPLDATKLFLKAMELGRATTAETNENEIVERYIEVFREVFSGRQVTAHLSRLSSDRMPLFQTSVESIAPTAIQAASLDRVTVRRESFRARSLDQKELDLSHVHVKDEGEHHLHEVPLVDGRRVVGTITISYEDTSEGAQYSWEADRELFISMAMSLESALRNARLLRESRQLRDYLGQLIDAANAPILVLSKRQFVKLANRAFLASTGWKREEVVGRDPIDLVEPNDASSVRQMLTRAFAGETISNFEIAFAVSSQSESAKNGRARFSMNTAPMTSARGEIEGVIAIGRDVTEVRQLEAQVIQAEKLATLGQLAAGVVHELNNPLTSISVYSDYLLNKSEQGPLAASDVEKLKRIHQNTERILRFTRDLVAYARPSGEGTDPVSLHEALDQSIVFCEHVAAEYGTTVVRNYVSRDLTVRCDKGQLHQVFINLITNACHAVPEGAGRIEITTKVDDTRAYVLLVDNGPGIPTELQRRVFEPFFSTKGEGKGTGLGLSIVKNIVEQHRGEIRVESVLGDGTTFQVSLPLHS